MGVMNRIRGLADVAGFEGVAKAFSETAMSGRAISQSVINNEMAARGTKLLREAASLAGDANTGIGKEIVQAMDAKTAEELIGKLDDNFIGKISAIDGKSEALQTALTAYREAQDIASSGLNELDKARKLMGREKPGLGIIGTAKGFYGDSEYGSTRLKATLAGAAGVAVGGRLLSGGSLTTNARGEHDIAGIPFI